VGTFLQLFKDFFLIIVTGFITIWFLKDYRKGLMWYLFFYAFISFVGLNRVTYSDTIILPLMIFVGVYLKDNRLSQINLYYMSLFVYMLFITYINGQTVMDSYSEGVYLFIIILVFSNYLFKDANFTIKVVFFIWLITIGIAVNSILFGENLFSISNINPDERNLIVNNGIQGSYASDEGIDLNYFGSGQATAAIITLLFIIFRKSLLNFVSLPFKIKKIFDLRSFQLFMYLILGVEIWLVLRGISRGGLLVFFAGVLAVIIVLRKYKYLFYGGLIIVAMYYIMNYFGIVDLYSERISNDDTGISGRDIIWIAMFGSIYTHGGIAQIIFGGGNGWPWWENWVDNTMDTTPSSHNQWMTIFVNVGLLGLLLFLVPLYKGIHNSIKHNNPINNIRIVLFVCLFIESMSLEPLIFTHYLWFILAIATTYTPNIMKIK